jgi:hypothetical protein
VRYIIGGSRDFFLCRNVRTGSGTLKYRGLFPGGIKWPEREDDHSSPSSAEVRNARRVTQTS